MRIQTASAVGFITLMLAGCTGTIGDADSSRSPDGVVPFGGQPGDPPERERGVGGMGYVRLTPSQWASGARQLLRLTTNVDARLSRVQPSEFHFDNDEGTLGFGAISYLQHQEAAEAVVEVRMAAADAWLIALMPSDAPQSGVGRTEAFARSLLKRAWRRAPSPDELAAWLKPFSDAPGADEAAKFKAGARRFMIALLQSPGFVYRTAVGEPVTPINDRVPLQAFELATRLSLALYDAPPDDAMLASVEAGDFSDAKLSATVDRALSDPRAREGLLRFHEQLYFAQEYPSLSKDATRFPGFSAGTGEHLRQDMLRTVAAVIDSGGGLAELFSTRKAFVNKATARLYGLDPSSYSDSAYTEVTLDANRAGVLTRAGWLAWGAGPAERRQVRRGLAMLHNVMCETYQNGEPQDFPKTFPNEAKTSRKRLEHTVSGGTCMGCHATIINPKGFAFEHFDAVGQYQTMDNTEPVDASGKVFLDGAEVRFASHVELMTALAASTQAQTCYARRMSHYLLGFEKSTLEDVLVARVVSATKKGPVTAKDIARIVILGSAFRTRKLTEKL